MEYDWNHAAKLLAIALVVGIVAKLAFAVPLILSAWAVSAWAFLGLFIQMDDWFPGSFSNPDGSVGSPYMDLGVRFLIFVVLGGLSFVLLEI